MSAFVETTAPEELRLAVVEVTITRYRLYKVFSTPGYAWKWEYSYSTDGSKSLDWGTSLVELRRVLKHRYPNAHISERFGANAPTVEEMAL